MQNLTKIKRPEAVNRLKAYLDGDNNEPTRMELRQIVSYITALEDANIRLQDEKEKPPNDKAFRAVCSRNWCKRVYYGATQKEAQMNAEQCHHLPNIK